MKQNDIAPVRGQLKPIFYNIERIFNSAVDIDMGGIFTHGGFYVERNSQRTFFQFFFNLMVFIDKR